MTPSLARISWTPSAMFVTIPASRCSASWRRLRAVTSRATPMNPEPSSSGSSPTESSIANVDPSFRRPRTSRPMPMIFGMPVRA